MSLDFLRNNCREPERHDTRFGLCDPKGVSPAYSDLENPRNWVAEVLNQSGLGLTFTPVDNCLIQHNELPGQGRCDGILTTFRHLYIVELKDQRRYWTAKAIEQLESTIEIFKATHDIAEFRHRKAFACNKCHPRFQVLEASEKTRFFRRHGVRLHVEATIEVR